MGCPRTTNVRSQRHLPYDSHLASHRSSAPLPLLDRSKSAPFVTTIYAHGPPQHRFWPKMGFQNFNTSIIMQVCLRLISAPYSAYDVWPSILATCLLGSIPPSSRSSSVPPRLLFISSDSPAMVIGIFSQWWVRTRHPRWFTKYKYVPIPHVSTVRFTPLSVTLSPPPWMVELRSSVSSSIS